MSVARLPSPSKMYRALLARDAAYDGIFVVAVRTTGIFCRPVCPARTPKFENITFYGTADEATRAGYRPCKRCRPTEPGGSAPGWLRPLLAELERDPARRWTDADLGELGLDPGRVRRWFRSQHGTTFHAYQRARRIGMAAGTIRVGGDLAHAAFDHGFESLSGFRDAWARHVGDAPGRSREAPVLTTTRLVTPLGPMVAGATDDGLALLEFAEPDRLEPQLEAARRALACVVAPGRHPLLDRLEAELAAYFEGRPTAFTVPLLLTGTPFQRIAWEYLRTIPYGVTRSYAEQARAIGRPMAVRAVGRANGRNRLAIVVPCHRVVAANGTLCGYGGGLWRKQFLLDLERRQAPGEDAQAGALFS